MANVRGDVLGEFIHRMDEFFGREYRTVVLACWLGGFKPVAAVAQTCRTWAGEVHGYCIMCDDIQVSLQRRIIRPAWIHGLSDLVDFNAFCWVHMRDEISEVHRSYFLHGQDNVVGAAMWMHHARRCRCDICRRGIEDGHVWL